MSYTYNLKVVVSAVDRATRPIKEVNRAISDMLSGLRRIPLIGPALDRVTSAFGELGETLQRVGRIAGGVFGALMAFEALRRVEDAVRRCVETFSEFEWTMMQVTLAGAGSLEAVESLDEELMKLARTVGREVGVGATQAAEALLALVKAGFSGAEAAEALRATLNMMLITGVSAEEASELLVQALAAFGLSAKDATRVVDALTAADLASIASARDLGIALGYCGAMAHTFGMSVEDALTAVAILTDRIGSAEKAGRYFDALLRDLIDKSDKLGVSVYEADGSMRPFAEIVADVAARLAGMTDAERATYLETVGFTAQSMRAILTLAGLGETAEEVMTVWSSYREQIGRTGLAQAMAEKQMDTLKGALMRMRATLQDAAITVGRACAPAISKFADSLGEVGAFIANALGPPLGWLLDKIAGLFKWFVKLGQAVMERLRPHLQELSAAVSGLVAPVDEAAEAFGRDESIIGALADLIASVLIPGIKLLTMALEAAKPVAEALAVAIDALRTAVDAVAGPIGKMRQAWENALNKMKEVYDATIGPILDKIEGFCDSVASFFEKLREKLVGGSVWIETWDEVLRVAEEGVRGVRETVEAGLGRFEAAFRPSVQVAPRLIAPSFGPIIVNVHGVVREEADIARLARAIEERVAYRLWLRAREVGVLWT